ncbi:MAG: hypothetical protein ABH879_06455 [archaeon]
MRTFSFEGKTRVLHGTSGIPSLDSAAVSFLSTAYDVLHGCRYLDLVRLERRYGHRAGEIGRLGLTGDQAGIGCVSYLNIGATAAERHEEGEYGFLPEMYVEGTLVVGRRKPEELHGTHFYHVPPGTEHEILPWFAGELGVLVMRYSPEIVEDFRLGQRFELKLSPP